MKMTIRVALCVAQVALDTLIKLADVKRETLSKLCRYRLPCQRDTTTYVFSVKTCEKIFNTHHIGYLVWTSLNYAKRLYN